MSRVERVNLYFEEPLYTFEFGGKNYRLKFIKRIKRTKIQQYLDGNSARLPKDFIASYLIRKLPKKEYKIVGKKDDEVKDTKTAQLTEGDVMKTDGHSHTSEIEKVVKEWEGKDEIDIRLVDREENGTS